MCSNTFHVWPPPIILYFIYTLRYLKPLQLQSPSKILIIVAWFVEQWRTLHFNLPRFVYHTCFILTVHSVKLKILLGNCLYISPMLQLSPASDTVSDIINTHSCRDALNRLTGKVFISWLTATWLPVDNIHRFISSFQQGIESATPQSA